MNFAKTAGGVSLTWSLAVAGMLAATLANAQTIERAPRPYVETPALPFAPAPALAVPVGVASGTVVSGLAGLRFDITASDRNVREALARWAKAAGWFHDPTHWTIDKDHPIEGIAGPDVFGPDFKSAVRNLLASTELTDRPVQPCFYTNLVVRVIPKAEFCDKTVE